MVAVAAVVGPTAAYGGGRGVRQRRPRGGAAAYFRRGWRGEEGGVPRMVGFERGGAERRREAISSAAREREGGAASAHRFTKKSVFFRDFQIGPSLRVFVDCGFDLWFLEGCFCKSVTVRSVGHWIASRRSGSCYCSTVAC